MGGGWGGGGTEIALKGRNCNQLKQRVKANHTDTV